MVRFERSRSSETVFVASAIPDSGTVRSPEGTERGTSRPAARPTAQRAQEFSSGLVPIFAAAGRDVPRSVFATDRVIKLYHFPILIAAFGLLCGCGKKAGKGGPMGGPGMMAVQVVAVEAKRQPVTESLALVGSVLANELVEIKSETEGTIQEINFKEGQRVEKGTLLLQLDETKFATALAEAESNYKLSQANYERASQLFKDRLISQQEYDQAAAIFNMNQATVDRRKRELQDARIYAPFSGVTGARNVSPGQVISKNTTLSWLVDLDPVKVEINVPERFLSQVQVGQDLELTVAAFADKKFRGKVYFVAPSVDPATRTALIKAEVPNNEHLLKPGMFAGLELTLKIRDNAVVIPEIALSQLMEGDRASVFVVDADSTVQTKAVKLGIRLPGQVEILGGLEGGEKVIIEGIQKVGPGAKVKIASEAPQAKS